MAWRRIGDKPLPEPMLTRGTDIYATLGGDELRNQVQNLFIRLFGNEHNPLPPIPIEILRIYMSVSPVILDDLDPSHKSHNALDKNPTMHHFMSQNGALWDMGLVHCGICAAMYGVQCMTRSTIYM